MNILVLDDGEDFVVERSAKRSGPPPAPTEPAPDSRYLEDS